MTANSLGLIGAHHIGITVPDLDQAIAFFRDVLGLEALVHSAPDQVNIGYVTTHLGAEEGSRLVRLAILPCLGANVELLEYTKPGGLGAAPAPSNNGATHLALSVKDAAAAARYLRDRGVMVLEGPSKVEYGDLAGLRWVYFRTPWGTTVELVEGTANLGYARRTRARLWDASQPSN